MKELEQQLFELRKENAGLKETVKSALTLLRDLADIQNGAPLVTVEEEWKEIMDSTYDFLEQHEERIEPQNKK